ncbi:hypothetical protein HELRODRAFT_166962 [Helobdella robusta]|uniref:Endonuclease/exonuclease/phosphatase domain-containing protein n=1 Tax=Helobdella robusta TaxID=6412 RepID=T1EYT4_HELRO|nr:hypothetical protein HELRODRAFT_166962 [Helobdella robusta]ESO11878.1 hypothetical protein HELRODRAFT_166962 [Helobdella robusta]
MPFGYHFLDFLKPYDPYHGGLIIFFRSNFKYKKIDLPCFSTFEVLAIKFFINGIDWVLVSLYRPSSQQVKTIFFQELVFMMEHVSILTTRILLAGDFNIHVERTDDAHTISLLEVFDMFQMVNNVNGSTHDLGGSLDLIVSSLGFPVQVCKIFPSGVLSDHGLIHATIPVTKADPTGEEQFCQQSSFRYLKHQIHDSHLDFDKAHAVVNS